MQPNPTPLSVKKQSALVRERADLLDIRLYAISAKRNGQAIEKLSGSQVDVNIQINARARVVEDGGKQILLILLTFKSQAKQSDSDDRKDEPEVTITYEVRYALANTEELTDEHYAAFAQCVSIYNVWPYYREFLFRVTTDMGLPTIRLPLYRPLSEHGTESDRSQAID